MTSRKVGRPRTEEQKEILTVYIQKDIKEKIKAEAREKGFSVSSYMSGMITAAFKA